MWGLRGARAGVGRVSEGAAGAGLARAGRGARRAGRAARNAPSAPREPDERVDRLRRLAQPRPQPFGTVAKLAAGLSCRGDESAGAGGGAERGNTLRPPRLAQRGRDRCDRDRREFLPGSRRQRCVLPRQRRARFGVAQRASPRGKGACHHGAGKSFVIDDVGLKGRPRGKEESREACGAINAATPRDLQRGRFCSETDFYVHASFAARLQGSLLHAVAARPGRGGHIPPFPRSLGLTKDAGPVPHLPPAMGLGVVVGGGSAVVNPAFSRQCRCGGGVEPGERVMGRSATAPTTRPREDPATAPPGEARGGKGAKGKDRYGYLRAMHAWSQGHRPRAGWAGHPRCAQGARFSQRFCQHAHSWGQPGNPPRDWHPQGPILKADR